MEEARNVNPKEPEWSEAVFLVDKPAGLTSFTLVRRIRRLLGIKKSAMPGPLIPLPPD